MTSDTVMKTYGCSHCDLGLGYRGMDTCSRCKTTGSVFRVLDKTFPNTREGYEAALEAEVLRLRIELDSLRPKAESPEPPKAQLGTWPVS